MMGIKERVFLPPANSLLDDLVPADRFYRHLEQYVDLGFVRELVRDRYAPGGRPSIDLILFFELQPVMFFEGIRSERKLIETASLNLAHRWYLGYALDEALPDHSCMTRIANTPALRVAHPFTLSARHMSASGPLHRRDRTLFPPNRRT
jgi:transposase